MKTDNDELFKWLASQKYEYSEWFSTGIEVISLNDLYKQSAIKTNAIENYLKRFKYESNSYTYTIDSSFNRIVRTSPTRIKKPNETKLGFTIRRIKEVTQ